MRISKLIWTTMLILGLVFASACRENGQAVEPASERPAVLAAETDNPRLTPVVRAVSQVAPTVVNITVSLVEQRQATFFDLWFGGPGQEYRSESIGSGVIIDGDEALVLTNAHVVNGATSISVRLLDGRDYKANVVGAEADFDLALLRLEGARGLPSVVMGDSSDLLPGETVIAIGNPYGFSHTVTTGVISALDRTITGEDNVFTDLIQTDAAINPGNSGGPLLNILGELIGINMAIDARGEGIGFAIPISKARLVVEEILAEGHVSPIWLALIGQDVDPQTARILGLSAVEGLLIAEVFADGPAALAGLRPGDVILSLNSHQVSDRSMFTSLLRNQSTRESLSLRYFRDGEVREVSLTPQVFSTELATEHAWTRWGIRAIEQGPGLRIEEIRPNSPAARRGLESGDYLTAISGRRITGLSDFLDAFRRNYMNQQLLLQVVRGNRSYQIRMGI